MVEGGVGLQETGPLGNFVHLQILYFKTAYLNLILHWFKNASDLENKL